MERQVIDLAHQETSSSATTTPPVFFVLPGFLLRLAVTAPQSRRRFPSWRIKGASLDSSPSSSVATRMQEQRSREAKKAVVTPLMNHMATPSSFPQPAGEAWLDEDRTLGSSGFDDRGVKKPEQLDVVVAAMEFASTFNLSPQGMKMLPSLEGNELEQI